MVSHIDNFETLQMKAASAPNGVKGLEFGLPPHLLDAANIFNECWLKLEPRAIAGCWVTSNCLKKHDIERLRDEYRGYRKVIEESTITSLCVLFKTVNFTTIPDFLPASLAASENNRAMFSRWLRLDDDAAVLLHFDPSIEL